MLPDNVTEAELKWLTRFIDKHGDFGIKNGEPYIKVQHEDYESIHHAKMIMKKFDPGACTDLVQPPEDTEGRCNNIIALYLLSTFSKIMKQKNPSLFIRDSLRIVGKRSYHYG